MFCYCQQDKSLTKYIMVYVEDKSQYVNADFIKEYGVIVDTVERTHPLLKWNKHTHTREVWALTIAEIFRLVQYEAGELHRKPAHRILSGDDKEVVTKCSLQNDEMADLTKLALERFLAT